MAVKLEEKSHKAEEAEVEHCVSNLIHAFYNGLNIFKKLRERRRKRKGRKENQPADAAASEEKQLSKSLKRGPQELAETYDACYKQTGQSFAKGDGEEEANKLTPTCYWTDHNTHANQVIKAASACRSPAKALLLVAEEQFAQTAPQQKTSSPSARSEKYSAAPPVSLPVRRRIDKMTPSAYTFASDSTKLGEIPQRSWTTPWDYEEADRLNHEARTAVPIVVIDEKVGRKKGIFKWMRN
ncbi:hypothetical protein SNOG_12256 [Parastagonospora nodorum SN15]|uniref:Uncharacterized protein n=1 Tax=Phaeosphaeria nodorum (strain SN15 / ATCC MYA-4574 / FGSC 10173) TaxID=321614 RepID=Q0U7K8_PHANO|nr:hypothetical protein SNOG_12256 [Parastagonospora nodorum SN15]EAT80668.2 hypothetical protein SNOG_12256 [Parastagonospora nodorum SN15]